jgi:7-cyano-7-deazaguanine reductase
MTTTTVHGSQLGKKSAYPECYNPKLLFAIPRSEARKQLNHTLFAGTDHWRGYELSWLNTQRTPQAGILNLTLDAHTTNLIESKSLKLYLNSLNNTCFDHISQVHETILNDLNNQLQADVQLSIDSLHATQKTMPIPEQYLLLDHLPSQYYSTINPKCLMSQKQPQLTQTYVSNLFRSNCPITNQPDWATVFIYCKGIDLDAESLHSYLLSYRNHQGFHEHCIEQIYCDILDHTQCSQLAVAAFFTRRGGLEINPLRHSPGLEFTRPLERTLRQ